MTGASAWEHFSASGLRLRPYQRRVVGELTSSLGEAGSRACLVAPPGAGKTLCALRIAAELQVPLEVLVPTTALVAQWMEQVRTWVVSPIDDSAPAPVRVTTYAGMKDFGDGALVVLDEAHHLCGTWGRQVAGRLGPSHRVLGLTATPPLDNKDFDNFVELVGRHPVEVETPPLVRDGHLCPYQDLVWPVVTQPEDVPGLCAASEALDRAEAAVRDELDAWVALRLQEDLWELTEARFSRNAGLLTALCRARRDRGLDIPMDLPRDADFEQASTLQDRARVLWAFGRGRPSVKEAVMAAGFRPAGRGLVRVDDLAHRSLAGSASRVRGLLDLLSAEAGARSDWLRALVLVDRDVEGDRLSARQVLKALVKDRRTDRLDPILVTGKALWVDDDLWPRMKDRLPELPWEETGGHFEVDVSSWPTARRVGVMTRLLTEGVTRCLVGTQHLLGEGWDCPAVNCVVDLTGIVASVTVNQVRGRGLRCDPADPAKVASMWEVIAVAPGVAGGGRMLERLAERHEHTLGIDSTGRIRAGVERIDPQLADGAAAVAADAESIRDRMAARAARASEIGDLWAVGRDYTDRRIWRVEDRELQPRRRRGVDVAEEPEDPLAPEASAWLRVRRVRGQRTAGVGLVGGLAAGFAALAVGPAVGLAVLGSAVAVVAGAGLVQLIQHHLDPPVFVPALHALHEAMVSVGVVQGELVVTADGARLEGTPEHAKQFAEAAGELLGPVRYPRYLLLGADGRAWPVPRLLASDRDLADTFARAWARHVGGCEPIYARKGRGRELLIRAWRSGSPRRVAVVEAWE